MSRIKDRDTSIEITIRKRLWAMGFRGYRLHSNRIPGKPDITYNKRKVAIFLDGDFWHGYVLKKRGKKLPKHWFEKITRNMERDKKYTRQLKEMGWRVIRVWENEILKDLNKALAKITTLLNNP